jgi:hypothetical protein
MYTDVAMEGAKLVTAGWLARRERVTALVGRRVLAVLVAALAIVNATNALEGRYTDNDSWSTNELDIDWQGVTLYNFYLARWWAAGAPPTRATLRSVPDSRRRGIRKSFLLM